MKHFEVSGILSHKSNKKNTHKLMSEIVDFVNSKGYTFSGTFTEVDENSNKIKQQ